MLLITQIVLHRLVTLNTLEHHLAEAVEVRDIGQLRVKELGHQRTDVGLVVNLHGDGIKSVSTSRL